MSNKPIYEHSMEDRTPYVYLLKNKTTGLFYYGVRFGKNCHPDDFWKTYFTSSKLVKDLIKKHGKADFEHEIRKKFDSKEAAIDWEQRVIRRFAKKSSVFLNLDDSQQPHLTIQNKYPTKSISDPVTGVCRRILADMEIPEGWVLGNLTPKKRSEKVSDRKWYYEPETLKLHHCNPSKADPSWIEGRPGVDTASNRLKRKYITNGIDTQLVLIDALIPDGWRKGKTKSNSERENGAKANAKFTGWKTITNGQVIKRIPPNDPLPTGFIFGKEPTSELYGDSNYPAKLLDSRQRKALLVRYENYHQRTAKELERRSKLKKFCLINPETGDKKMITPDQQIPDGFVIVYDKRRIQI